MFLYLLPQNIQQSLSQLDVEMVYEVRLRCNQPVVINYKGKNMLLKKTGTTENIYATREMVDYVVKLASENSIYAYNNQIKQGFITARGGVRIGIAGESVFSDNLMPKTLKDICGVNIRVPHQIKNCSQIAFKFMYNKDVGLKNTLIISPPGAGKTTFLRDIACQISRNTGQIYNTLIVDERFEIASVVNGQAMLDIGDFADIVSGGNKRFAFENGIRALKPDVIITDELMGEQDVFACKTAIMSGVKVIASVHATCLADLKQKGEFKQIFSSHCFDRYVVLSNRNGAGTYDGIFDENEKCIYF